MKECKYCGCEAALISNDPYNGYELEIDPASEEIIVWNGDDCVASMNVKYCPMCGKKLRIGENNEL